EIETARQFAAELDVRNLVLANWNDKALPEFRIDRDICGLQNGITEKAVGVEVFVLDLLELLLVRGNPFEPPEGGDHGEEQMQFRVLRHQRLQKNGGLGRVEARGQKIDRDLQRVLSDSGGIRIIRRQRVPVHHAKKAIVSRIRLQPHPVLQRAEIVPDVQPPCRSHAAQNAIHSRRGQVVRTSLPLNDGTNLKGYQISLIRYQKRGSFTPLRRTSDELEGAPPVCEGGFLRSNATNVLLFPRLKESSDKSMSLLRRPVRRLVVPARRQLVWLRAIRQHRPDLP